MSRVPLGLAVLAASLLSSPRLARAESPNSKATPVYVLSILTDDADDQADGLTQALRARVRQAPGWSLLETPQSLETLTIALRCPPRPDPPCLQRIGDQLHADHYIWGSLAKKKQGEVSADVHFWTRGKPEAQTSESYNESLKEPGDEGLRVIAARLFEQLTAGQGTGGAMGTLVIHAGSSGGTVWIDGAQKGTLDEGVARIDIPDGSHKVTVHVPGFEAPSLTTTVKAGSEKDVSFALVPGQDTPETEPSEAHAKPFPTRKVAAYALIGGGVASLTVAIISGVKWLSDKNASDNDRSSIPTTVTDVCATPINDKAGDACNLSHDATTWSTVGWVTAGLGVVLGGAGVWLLTTDHAAADTSGAALSRDHGASASRLAITPVVGLRAGTVQVRLSF